MLSSPNVLLTRTAETASIFCQAEAKASCFPASLARHAARNRLNVQHTGVLHSSAIFNKALSTVSDSVMNQHIFASSLSGEGLERQNWEYFSLFTQNFEGGSGVFSQQSGQVLALPAKKQVIGKMITKPCWLSFKMDISSREWNVYHTGRDWDIRNSFAKLYDCLNCKQKYNK